MFFFGRYGGKNEAGYNAYLEDFCLSFLPEIREMYIFRAGGKIPSALNVV